MKKKVYFVLDELEGISIDDLKTRLINVLKEEYIGRGKFEFCLFLKTEKEIEFAKELYCLINNIAEISMVLNVNKSLINQFNEIDSNMKINKIYDEHISHEKYIDNSDEIVFVSNKTKNEKLIEYAREKNKSLILISL